MRTSRFSLRRYALLLPVGAAVLAASLIAAAPPENEQSPADASESVALPSDLPADAVDLTDKVEITVVGNLRSSSRTAHSITFTVKNTSKDDLAGPIAVLVDQTGIEELKLTQTDGKLSDDRPYVQIVAANDALKAGRTLRSQKLNFTTDEPLKPALRPQFDLKVRVCRIAPTELAQDTSELIEGKSYTQKQLDQVMAIQEKWTMPLMRMGNGNVYGTAVTETDKGELAVQVYTQRPGLAKDLPQTLDGIPVRIKTTGERFSAHHPKSQMIYDNGRAKVGAGDKIQGPPRIDTFTDGDGVQHPGFSGPGGDPTIRFARPVPIGVSIANADRLFDIDPFEPVCYSGTLGCRCVDSLGTKYILTNIHVGGAFEIIPEGDPIPIGLITGFPGETIVQPGTGDAGMCGFDLEDPVQLAALLAEIGANEIGFVSDVETIFTTNLSFIPCQDDDSDAPFCAPVNYMDACVAEVTTATTSFDTPVGGYDIPNRQAYHNPRIGTPVRKYGRTTIYTEGTVTAINAAVAVGYNIDDDNYGYFEKQLEIANLGGFQVFVTSGDSGSLIVTDMPGHPDDRKPVALVFAAGGGTTIANPIGPVLARFGLMVDDGSGAPSTGGVSGTSGGVIAPVDPPSRLR